MIATSDRYCIDIAIMKEERDPPATEGDNSQRQPAVDFPVTAVVKQEPQQDLADNSSDINISQVQVKLETAQALESNGNEVDSENSTQMQEDSPQHAQLGMGTTTNVIKIEPEPNNSRTLQIKKNLGPARNNIKEEVNSLDLNADDDSVSRPVVAGVLKVELPIQVDNVSSNDNIRDDGGLVQRSRGFLSNQNLPRTARCGSWSRRAVGKTTNVIQTILNRQLGLPFYSREDNGYFNYNEMTIGRQLISRRATADDGKKSTSLPSKLMTQKDKKKLKSISHIKSDWIHLQLNTSNQNSQIGMVDTGIWSRILFGPARNNVYSEDFYSFEPAFGFLRNTQMKKSMGKQKNVTVLFNRALNKSSTTSTFLVTLNEPNHLRAFDINKRKVTCELDLDMDFFPGTRLKGYSGLSTCDVSSKLFVMAIEAGDKKNVKAIIILEYPPAWTKVGIIYIEEIQIKLNIDDGLCFISIPGKKIMHLTTWTFLRQKDKKMDPTGRTPAARLQVMYEGRLSEMPTILKSFTFETENFGLVSTIPRNPLCYVKTKEGLTFEPLINLVDGPSSPVHQFTGVEGKDDPIEVLLFPDGSPRVLICTHLSNKYEVVTFKTNDQFDLEAKVSHPVNYQEEAKARRRALIASTSNVSRISRPRRSCVQDAAPVCSEKMSILGFAYCSQLDLIAVLTADDEEFSVVLYEPLKLSVFKALPSLYVWPPMKDGNSNARRDYLQSVDLGFETHYIFISFEYSSACKPQREFYCFPLMSTERE